MSVIILETPRLILQRFTLEDSDFILRLVNTEGWLKYIGDRNIKTIQQAGNYLLIGPIQSYQQNGFGLSRMTLKPDGTSIGMCGLIRRDYLPHPDLGFALLPEYGRNGYALEMAKAMIAYGLHHLNLPAILAITLPSNEQSISVLQKAGMRFLRKMISKDTEEELNVYGTSTLEAEPVIITSAT